MNEIPDSHEIICGGQLNATVLNQVQSKVVAMHGEKTLNNNLERLINICQYELSILNEAEFFACKNIHKYTWYRTQKI